MYLLDTDTCIELARNNRALVAKLRDQRREDIFVSMHSFYEMEFGIAKATQGKARKRKALDHLMALLQTAPFGHPEAKETGKLRAELERAGKPIGSIDYLIAGTARANKWKLVTGNVTEFQRVRGLKVETWHK